MSAGFLEKWSDVEEIWDYLLYSELGIEEASHPLIITEVANTPKKHREKMAEVGLLRGYWDTGYSVKLKLSVKVCRGHFAGLSPPLQSREIWRIGKG